jgi:hypothetical protein
VPTTDQYASRGTSWIAAAVASTASNKVGNELRVAEAAPAAVADVENARELFVERGSVGEFGERHRLMARRRFEAARDGPLTSVITATGGG